MADKKKAAAVGRDKDAAIMDAITKIILEAKEKARKETSIEPEPGLTHEVTWPIQCTVGPGLEGAIACETKIGYVNGSKGWLVYRGYDIFDLCAYSTFEEVTYLLLHGKLPNKKELADVKKKFSEYRHLPATKRLLMSFPVEDMNPMAALRLGSNLMRQKQTYRDHPHSEGQTSPIASDEDSIPMETKPMGTPEAVYEFKDKQYKKPAAARADLKSSEDIESCYRIVAGVSAIAAAIARIRRGGLPIEPHPDLGFAANFLYMLTGKVPTALEERILDICFILHADHGMNASTFAAMVVASTLSDIYFSIGAGIGALNGPLHGGANEEVMRMLQTIGGPDKVDAWYAEQREKKTKISGFGHRVYKAYDPRARVLGPLAELLIKSNKELKPLFDTAKKLEKLVVGSLGKDKKIFPNVDFYSGFVYKALGISPDFFTVLFAVARTAGWTARVLEYLEHNRIFRPRAMYTGEFNKVYKPLEKR